jgi:hypothetical protein
MGWNGAGGWLIASQARQENFSHMLDHPPLPRNELQRLRDVFADLAQPVAAAARAIGRSRMDDALTRQMLGQLPAGRTLPLERVDFDVPGFCSLCRKARRGCQKECVSRFL